MEIVIKGYEGKDFPCLKRFLSDEEKHKFETGYIKEVREALSLREKDIVIINFVYNKRLNGVVIKSQYEIK